MEKPKKSSGGGFLLAKPPTEQETQQTPQNYQHYIKRLNHSKLLANTIIQEGYYRQFLITIKDKNLERYSENTIADIIDYHLSKRSHLSYIIVPDYEPSNGRLHYHGLINNFNNYREIGKLKLELSELGHIFIKNVEIDTPDYLFKIYETNTKTKIKTQTQELKYILTHTNRRNHTGIFKRTDIRKYIT